MADGIMSLTELINEASERIGIIFEHVGQILPMYYAIRSDGHHMIIVPPDTDKHESFSSAKEAFQMMDIDTYVFVSEAWVLALPPDRVGNDDDFMRHSIEHHPDRREAIVFSAENLRGECQLGNRFILRPEHGDAKLSPLSLDAMSNIKQAKGRMVGLLRRES